MDAQVLEKTLNQRMRISKLKPYWYKMMNIRNPISLTGLAFIEYVSLEPEKLIQLFSKLGFIQTAYHKKKSVLLFEQGCCRFVINKTKNSFSEDFAKVHGPSICSVGFFVEDSQKAYKWAVAQGAKAVEKDDSHSFPAIYGVGESLIYFVEEEKQFRDHFQKGASPSNTSFLLAVDHFAHSVPRGQMNTWCEFYKQIFNFSERPYFDTEEIETGFVSRVMFSKNHFVTIPISEPSVSKFGDKSQIQKFLEEYKGAGIQHIALKTASIIEAIERLRKEGLSFMNMPDTYYDTLKQRVPLIKEDIVALKKNNILGDGDDKGYLLQIFTNPVIGPIFFEIIQKHNHSGFGGGNFQAFFDAIERDQIQKEYMGSV